MQKLYQTSDLFLETSAQVTEQKKRIKHKSIDWVTEYTETYMSTQNVYRLATICVRLMPVAGQRLKSLAVHHKATELKSLKLFSLPS